MNTIYMISGILTAVAVLLGSAIKVVRALNSFVDAVKTNTTATQKLSAKFDAHSTETQNTLTDHAERITRLEARP